MSFRVPDNVDYNSTLARIPEHVPPELVRDFDYINVTVDDPIEFWKELDRNNIPDIFFTMNNGGHWTMRRIEDVRAIMRNPERFGNFPSGLPVLAGRLGSIPSEVDPPLHKKYRAVLAPPFTPGEIKKRHARIREVAVKLIENVVDKGHCNFIKDVAGRMPTALFLEIMGMPVERLDEFLVWEEDIIRGTPDKSKAAMEQIEAFLTKFMKEQARNPGDDVTGVMLKARDKEGNSWSDEELMSATFMLFTAGLDTVTNTMAFIWRYLARNPEARRYIRENLHNPIKMSCIFDELMRTNSVIVDTRRVRVETVYKGLLLKKGDVISLPVSMANYDPALVDHPDTVDLTREVNPHVAFGMADHRCLGSLLAKAEIEICLQEWLMRIPDFSIAPGTKFKCSVGTIAGMDKLPLVWEVS